MIEDFGWRFPLAKGMFAPVVHRGECHELYAAVCRLLHFGHVAVLRILAGLETISELEFFAARYGLGAEVTPLVGVHAVATIRFREDQRAKVEAAYQQLYHTDVSLRHVR